MSRPNGYTQSPNPKLLNQQANCGPKSTTTRLLITNQKIMEEIGTAQGVQHAP